MAKLAGVSLALLLCVSVSWSVYADGVDRARGLILSGQRGDAIVVLDSLIATRGADKDTQKEARFLRATLEGDGALFENRLKLLLKDGPDKQQSVWIHMNLGRIAFARKNILEAREHFQRALASGKTEEGSLWVGLCQMILGDAPSAKSHLETAARSGNRAIRTRAHLALGDMYRYLGNLKDAIEWYEKGHEEENSPWAASCLFRKSECLEQRGDLIEAREALTELCSSYPQAYEVPLAWSRLNLDQETLTTAEDDEPVVTPREEKFALQVGAFTEEENAEELVARLKERGLSEIRVDKDASGLHRVMVGKFGSRSAAETLGESLLSLLESGYRIVPLSEN